MLPSRAPALFAADTLAPMGFLSEQHYRASLPYLDDDDLETDEIGSLGNARETTARQVVLERVEVDRSGRKSTETRARYGEEIPIEFGGWERHLERELLGRRHSWIRQECHAKHADIHTGDCLVVAELPFAGRRRYDRVTFRPALRKDKPPHFGPAFEAKVQEARTARGGDLVTAALSALEDGTLVSLDPFNTGAKRVAGISLPRPPFGEEPKGHSRAGGQGEDGRTGWAFGVCRDPKKVFRAVELELRERIGEVAQRQAREDGESTDDRLRFARAPAHTKAGRLRLTEDVPDKADVLLRHAAWQAIAGPREVEMMPEERSVAPWRFGGSTMCSTTSSAA